MRERVQEGRLAVEWPVIRDWRIMREREYRRGGWQLNGL